jgi:dUTP pyrophosphatase
VFVNASSDFLVFLNYFTHLRVECIICYIEYMADKNRRAVPIKCFAAVSKDSEAPGAMLPSYQSAGAAGADVYAYIEEPVVIPRGEWAPIPTGLYFEIPDGYEIQVRPRSGLAVKHGITLLNSPGTIDSDYRGELRVLLVNHGKEAYTVNNGDRIAQLVVSEVTHACFIASDSLAETRRGAGGFGSTGK